MLTTDEPDGCGTGRNGISTRAHSPCDDDALIRAPSLLGNLERPKPPQLHLMVVHSTRKKEQGSETGVLRRSCLPRRTLPGYTLTINTSRWDRGCSHDFGIPLDWPGTESDKRILIDPMDRIGQDDGTLLGFGKDADGCGRLKNIEVLEEYPLQSSTIGVWSWPWNLGRIVGQTSTLNIGSVGRASGRKRDTVPEEVCLLLALLMDPTFLNPLHCGSRCHAPRTRGNQNFRSKGKEFSAHPARVVFLNSDLCPCISCKTASKLHEVTTLCVTL